MRRNTARDTAWITTRDAAPVASLRWRIFSALALVSICVSLAVAVASSYVLQATLVTDAHDQLSQECSTIASLLDDSSDIPQALEGMSFDKERATLIAPDGVALFDSQVDASTLPNHSLRPEVASALSVGSGSSERQSETVGYVSIYEAIRLPDGTVLRLSEDRAGAMALLWSGMGWIVMVLVALVVVSWFSSLALSRRLVRPVLEIDPTLPDGKAPYRELEPLVSKLREQQGQLEGQMRRLRGIDAMRREFTANVTHEFKTPIASILGASELIRDGVVKPEDIRNFAGHIHDDARRLSSLVSDILTLSKLDESERSLDRTVLGSLSPCDLLDIARDVVARLRAKAENAHVTLTFEGKPIVVRGYPRLIDEMIGNLVDNAIRYNESGGSVAVQVGLRDDRPVIRVRDTGIGIPPEDQQKVFERFYRVDKSRSRSHGGTGLGLAIVKHVANIHDTDITLQSTVGVGTTVTLTFPPERYREEKSA